MAASINLNPDNSPQSADSRDRPKSESQARIFDTVLNSILDLVYVLGRDGRFIYANQRLLNLLNITLDEIIGKNFFDLGYPPRLAERLQRQIQEVVDTKQVVKDETAFRSPTGVDGFYEYILTPVLADDGLVEVVAGSTRNVTERKQVQNALQASREQLQVLVESVPLGFYLVDDDLRIQQVNPVALPFFGGIPDLIGQPFDLVIRVLWSSPFADDLIQRFRHTLETGEPYFVSEGIETRRDNGMLEYYEWQINRIPLPGDRHAVVCYFRDISASVRSRAAIAASEESVRLVNEELEHRVEERTHLLVERTKELAHVSGMRQELLRQLVTAQEQERGRISRDLHDDTGQQVTALILGLGNLSDSAAWTSDHVGKEKIKQLQALAGEVAKKSHQLSFTLRPTALDDIGLMGALTNYAEEWARWSELTIDLQSVGMEKTDPVATVQPSVDEIVRLPAEIETTIYRVTQEALTNILRHAVSAPSRAARLNTSVPAIPARERVDREDGKREPSSDGPLRAATRVSIVIQRSEREVAAIIEDDGPGFDVEATLSLPPGERRLGIFGMQERAQLAGGTLTVESTPGIGTTVFLHLPLA